MKTPEKTTPQVILVPTDFSKAAENAIHYAAEIAQLTHARLILFHVIHAPMLDVEFTSVIPVADDLETGCMEALKKIEQKLLLRYGKKLLVESACTFGSAADEINRYASRRKADLVIMGMQGAGYLAERFIGSKTTSLIYKSSCPVLAIDQGIKFRSIKKIALAYDGEGIKPKILGPLKNFVKLFKSHLFVLNVVPELEPANAANGALPDFVKLERSLVEVRHSFHYLEDDDVVDGINHFVAEEKMDMVVMIPHSHSILANIFREPTTKRMAFHAKVPLLALH